MELKKMSRNISQEIHTSEINEDGRIFCEVIGREEPVGFQTNGSGYSQECGGWRCKNTGHIYAAANWGSGRRWTTNIASIEYNIDKMEVISKKGLVHRFDAQMNWWFKQKNIDTSSMEAINFRWSGCDVGTSYTIKQGPQKNDSISESLPAQIPRILHDCVRDIKVVGNNACNMSYEISKKVINDVQPVFKEATIILAESE